MTIILLIMLGVLLLIGLMVRKSFLAPFNIFTALWFLIFLVFEVASINGVIVYNDISSLTYLIIGMGVFAFFIGGIIGSGSQPAMNTQNKRHQKNNIRIKVVIVLEILTLVLFLPGVIYSIYLLENGSTLENIRALSSTGGLGVIKNHLLLLLINYIVRPFVMILMPINAIVFFDNNEDKKNKFVILALSIIIVLLASLRDGSRSAIVYFVLNFFLAAILTKKKNKISHKQKFIIVLLLCVALFSYSAISISRGIQHQFKSLVMYFTGCLPLLDSKIKILSTESVTLTVFYTPLEIISSFMQDIGIPYSTVMVNTQTIINEAETVVIIGPNLNYNAFVSLFYYFYADLGYFGVLFYSLIYGFLSGRSYKKVSLSNKYSLALYLFLLQGIIFSFIRFQFVVLYYCFGFVILQFLFEEEKNEDINCFAVKQN